MKCFLILCALLLVNCRAPKDPSDEKSDPIENVDDCSAGCENLRQLECTDILDELNETTGTCEEACAYVIENGSSLGVEDWKNFKSCDEFNH